MYWVTGILGLILLGSPFVFGYTDNTQALWTSLIAGGGVVVMSTLEALRHERENWEYYVAGILGAAAIVATFAFGFRATPEAFWVSITLGTLIAVMAISRTYQKRF